MACRKEICHECATRWDDINYCVACLASRRKTGEEGSGIIAWILVGGITFVLLLLLQRLVVGVAVMFAEAF